MKTVWLAATVCFYLGALSTHAQTPSIQSFSPKSGPVGTQVVIKGNNFLDVTEVTFGGGASAAGTYKPQEITVTVPSDAKNGPITVFTDNGNTSTSQDFVITAPAPTPSAVPVITSATDVSGMMDQPFTYQITADRPVSSYAAFDLPAGLSLDPASGLISGTPEQTYDLPLDISATDAKGTGSASVFFHIASDAPAVTVSVAPPRIAAADSQTATFTFHLSHPVPRATFVDFFYSGDAAIQSTLSKSVAKIPAGKTTGKVIVTFHLTTVQISPTGVVKFKLKVLPDSPGTYTVSASDTARVKIVEP